MKTENTYYNDVPEGWLVWSGILGKVFIPHPSDQTVNDYRVKLEKLGHVILGPVNFIDWKPKFKEEQPTMSDEPYVNESEAAKVMGLTKRFMQDRRMRGDGPPFIRISTRCIRYKISDVRAWVEKFKWEK